MKKNEKLEILLNDKIVGELEKDPKGNLDFTYDNIWLKTSDARPISLSMPLQGKSYSGNLVYNFFDNLLPDNQQVRNRIQAKFKVRTNHPFDILKVIGKDCVGAIQIVQTGKSNLNKQMESKSINSKQIANIINNFNNYPLGMNEDDEFRISIAGAQEKTAFLYHKNKWNIPLNETPTTHIFKLPIGYIQHQNLDLTDSCENEWLCGEIARAFGLETAKSEILTFENTKVLVVERFDRHLSKDGSWIVRLPQEDMCQALGVSSNLKYQSDGGPGIGDIMNLLLGSADPLNERDNFYKAQILFWLLAAIDGHAKNFSLFIESQGKYRLTPLYDIISAYPLIEKGQLNNKKVKMAMALKGKNNHYHWNDLQRRYFIETAKKINYSSERAEFLLDEMLAKMEDVIEAVLEKIPPNFSKKVVNSIFEGMRLTKKRLTK